MRRKARAILLDEDDRLVLIKRVRPGGVPYLVTVGGSVEPWDDGPLAALHREVREEIGGTVECYGQVRLISEPGGGGTLHHLFLARLRTMDPAARTGPEFADPGRGTYEVERIAFTGEAIRAVNLVPPQIAAYLAADAAALLALARRAG